MILHKPNKLYGHLVLQLNRHASNFTETIKLNDDKFRQQVIANFKKAPKIRQNSAKSRATAAVLIPICVKNNEISLVYTLRSSKLKNHTRQVSFPGGIRDPSDVDFIDCALRETEEEIGIPRKYITVWGTGNEVSPTFGPTVTPVIGHINEPFESVPLRINPDEVEKVFSVPIARLASPSGRGHTQFRVGYSIPVFIGGEERVWGMTAIITHLFLLSLLPKTDYDPKIKYLKSYRS